MLLGFLLVITAMVTGIKVYLLETTKLKAQMSQERVEPAYSAEQLSIKNKIFDEKHSLSERMIAINSLAQSQNELSLEILKDFIATPFQSTQAETENILRTKAIEDIAYYIDRDKAITTLESLEAKQKHTFLGDQMRRVVVALRFKQPIVQHTEAELRQIYQVRMGNS